MEFEVKIRVEFLPEVEDFLNSISAPAKKKILYNIYNFSRGEQISGLFRKIEGTRLFEFRILFEGTLYRLLAFWDREKKSFIIVTNGFIKKTQKTPKKEIEQAEELRKRYYDHSK